MVTHKEIQVEIVPSDMAKRNNDIEFYEIEFKGLLTNSNIVLRDKNGRS